MLTDQDIEIERLKNTQSFMAEKLDDLKDTVVNGFEKMEKRFEQFICDSDKKYASKPTEWIVYGLVSIVLTSFIGGLIILIWK